MTGRSRHVRWLPVVATAAIAVSVAPSMVASQATTDVAEPRAAVAGAQPTVSADGRLVAFAGAPPAGDARTSTVWLQDRTDGSLVELTTPVPAVRAGDSVLPSISADGCVVAVVTEEAYDLYRDDDAGDRWDVYRIVLPACGGQPGAWELVSAVARPGAAAHADDGVDPTDRPAISASGAQIAYTTRFGPERDGITAVDIADLTIPVDAPGRTTQVAGTPTVGPDTTFRYHGLRQPSMSADGSVIAFTSDARSDLPTPTWGLGPTPGAFATSQVYVWDRAVADPAGAVVPVSTAGGAGGLATEADGDVRSPALSADGRFVAFESTSTDLVADLTVPLCAAACVPEVYRFDRTTSDVVAVSRSAEGVGADLGATRPAISADGSQVAFVTRATNLLPTAPGTGGEADDGEIVVAEVDAHVLRRASTQADGITPAPAANAHPQLSSTGRVVVFDTLVAGVYGTPAMPPADPAAATVARRVVALAQQPVVTLTDLDVGTVAQGIPGAEWSVAVVNRGPSTFVPSTVQTSNPDFAVTGGTCALGSPVAPGAFCTVTVVLTPSVLGPITGTIEVAEAGFGATSVSASLSGAGGEPALSPDPTGVLLAPTVVGETSDPVEISIANVGLLPTRIRAAEVTGADPDDFAVDATACTRRALDASIDCPIEVSFTPTASGHRSAVVNVTTTTGQYTSVLVTGDASYRPVLAVADEVALTGRTIEVTGSGFPASTEVLLSWSDDPAHAVALAADGAGAFAVGFPVSPVERGGDRQLVAQAPDAVASVTIEVAHTPAGRLGQPLRPTP